MIDSIIAYSTKNRLTVAGMVAVLSIWGFMSLQKLPIDAIPDITNKQVTILSLCPNLGPIEVERFVTSPIEIEMSNIKGLDQIRSISKFGLSSTTIVFGDEVDLYWARQQVFERLSTVTDNLPENAGKPQLAPITTGIGEIYQYVLRPKNPNDTSFSLMEMRTIQDWVIRKNLLGSPGIADISSFGGYKKEYHAKIKPEKLRAYNVTIEELFEAMRMGNNNTGGAYIEKDNRSYIVRGIGLATNIEDIQNTFIKINDNVPVLVKDVADVGLGSSTRYGAMTMNGKGEVVGAVVLLQMGENASDVIKQLEVRLAEIQKLLPEELEIKPFINREALVSRTIQTVTKNLVEGAIVVLLVLMLFLGDIIASLIAASVIPLAMLFTFGMMQTTGVIGNLMSLGALDFGLIVDGSVIVVESVAMSLAFSMRKIKRKMSYEERQDEVIKAVGNIKDSVFFGTLIILIVYTPILFLSGVEGKMFRPMAMTVAFAIVGALILSFTYVPMMCASLMSKPHHEGGFSDRFVDFLYYKIYYPAFDWAVRKKGIIIGSLVFLLLAAGFTFTQIGGEFIPKLDEGDIQIETRLPVGTSLSQSIETSLKIEKALLEEFPDEIENVIGKIGTSEIPLDPVPMESTDILISTKDKSHWTRVHSKAELIEHIMEVYERFPGLTPSVQQPIEARFNDLLSGGKTDVVFKLYGDDLKTMTHIGQDLMRVLGGIEGAKDIQMQMVTGLPQIQIAYNRRDIALYGISVQQINDVIQTAFAGKTTGIIYEADRRYDLVVKLASNDRNKVETLQNLLIKDFKGNMIPLKQLATITMDIGPSEIRHINKMRCIQVGTNVRGRDMESLVKEAQIAIKKEISLPYGYIMEAGGQYENLRKAKERLQIVVPIALLIIYALLFASFRTAKESTLIFTAVPMSAIGGIFALFVTGINFSISAGVGFICLFGIAVLNGIMLVSHFKLLKQEGLTDIFEIVKQGVKEKFRPVLMTSAVAALGFLPMALATGSGAEVQKPLATVVIGGLLVSTILTLVVLPVLYLLINKTKSTSNTV
jgi:heavy metal efflux system protein